MSILPRTKYLFLLVIVFTIFLSGRADAELFMNIGGKAIAVDDNSGFANVNVVLMSITKGPVANTKTDLQGNFALKGVLAGEYELIAQPDDPFVQESQAPVRVTVPKGKNVMGIVVKLQRGGAVKGQVVTNTGKGIPQVNVITSGASTITDQNGNFLLKQVAPGSTTISILPPALGMKTKAVLCEAGKIVDMGSIIFSIGPETAIRGTVVDSAGTPVGTAIIVAYAKNTSSGYAFSAIDVRNHTGR